jgi:hypothetical protein
MRQETKKQTRGAAEHAEKKKKIFTTLMLLTASFAPLREKRFRL